MIVALKDRFWRAKYKFDKFLIGEMAEINQAKRGTGDEEMKLGRLAGIGIDKARGRTARAFRQKAIAGIHVTSIFKRGNRRPPD